MLALTLTLSLSLTLTLAVTHTHTRSPSHSHSLSLRLKLTYSLSPLTLTHTHTHSHSHSLTHSLPPTHSLHPSLPPSLPPSLTHSLTHHRHDLHLHRHHPTITSLDPNASRISRLSAATPLDLTQTVWGSLAGIIFCGCFLTMVPRHGAVCSEKGNARYLQHPNAIAGYCRTLLHSKCVDRTRTVPLRALLKPTVSVFSVETNPLLARSE